MSGHAHNEKGYQDFRDFLGVTFGEVEPFYSLQVLVFLELLAERVVEPLDPQEKFDESIDFIDDERTSKSLSTLLNSAAHHFIDQVNDKNKSLAKKRSQLQQAKISGDLDLTLLLKEEIKKLETQIPLLDQQRYPLEACRALLKVLEFSVT